MRLQYDHAHFRCADLEQAIAFYQKLLDAEIVKRSEHGGRIIVWKICREIQCIYCAINSLSSCSNLIKLASASGISSRYSGIHSRVSRIDPTT